MIALCREHHAQADAGAFTREQLRELKRAGRDRAHLLQGRFNWMREELLDVIGGIFYVRVPIAVQIENVPVIYFNRDDSGRLLLNVNMPSMAAEPRMVMVDNLWVTPGADEAEIRCPPSGRLVEAKYPNGDHLKVEFREIQTADDFESATRLPPCRAMLSSAWSEAASLYPIFPTATRSRVRASSSRSLSWRSR